MESQIRGLNQAVRNANDGIAMVQTADGAIAKIGDMLQRMRELAVQAQNGTNSSDDTTNINKEFAALATEIDRVAEDTTFNNLKVLNRDDVTSATINVGADASDDITVNFLSYTLEDGANTATASVYDLVLTQAQMNTGGSKAVADTSTMVITNEAGFTATVLNSDMTTAGASTGFSDGTLTHLVTAMNAAIDRSTNFSGMLARAGGNGIEFVQDAAGTGSILSVVANTSANVSSTMGAISVTTPYAAGNGVMGINMSTWATADNVTAQAGTTIGYIDTAITNLVANRADLGAAVSSLEQAVDSLRSGIQNASSAKSNIMDADYAAETTELARTQIISQAATAMLSQANQQAQSVLALLK
jgi:flagellin